MKNKISGVFSSKHGILEHVYLRSSVLGQLWAGLNSSGLWSSSRLITATFSKMKPIIKSKIYNYATMVRALVLLAEGREFDPFSKKKKKKIYNYNL